MIQKIKQYWLTASTMLLLFLPVVGTTVTASAVDPGTDGCAGITSGVQAGVNSATNASGVDTGPGALTSGGGVNCNDTNVNDDAIKKLAAKITNTFSVIVGAASVIMIIYGGFRYITSGGESGRVGAAKNALLYAIVGLVIVALAQLIIHFVLSQATSVTNGT